MKIGQVSQDWSFVGKDTTVLFLFSIQLSKKKLIFKKIKLFLLLIMVSFCQTIEFQQIKLTVINDLIEGLTL